MAHKILLIDDERVNVALIKFGLAGNRYDVIEAVDGIEGLAKVNEENPDIIILDVMMPNMNGYEFMGELKALQGFQTTPVIMLTANETMEEMFKVEGVKAYFVKPVMIGELVAKIVECIGANPLE